MTPAMPAFETPVPDVQVSSALLGELRVPETQIYDFRHGIFGFPRATSFALLPTEREGVFWLQSTLDTALAFLLVDPFRFVEGYAVDLDEGELSELGPDDPSEILLLAILSLPKSDGDPTTVNLQGPVALNVVRRRGRQVVVESDFGLRHPVDMRRTVPGR